MKKQAFIGIRVGAANRGAKKHGMLFVTLSLIWALLITSVSAQQSE